MPESKPADHCKRSESESKSPFCSSQPSYRTYFISGFDPRGASHYIRLFQKELNGRGCRTGRRITNGLITRWSLEAKSESSDQSIQLNPCELSFLHWDDIARENWPKKPLEILKKTFVYAYFYLCKGWFIRIAKLCPGVALCGAYPLLFALFAFSLSAGLANLLRQSIYMLSFSALFSTTVGLIVLLLMLYVSWKIGEKLGVIWLTRSILFTHRVGQCQENSLRQRVGALARELILLEAKYPAQKIRLVGHSSGSFVMAMIAAELKRNPCAEELLARTELLTLGQNLSNLSVYPNAQQFREDLTFLASSPRIPWRDVTSKDDMLCFAGVDPYKSSGLRKPAGDQYPIMELVTLSTSEKKSESKNQIFNQFNLHFDYLRNQCHEVDFPGLLIGIGDEKKTSNV